MPVQVREEAKWERRSTSKYFFCERRMKAESRFFFRLYICVFVRSVGAPASDDIDHKIHDALSHFENTLFSSESWS